MLTIDNLHASIDGKDILKGLNLRIGAGEIHAIMGPNGSGKSTLTRVLAGDPRYVVTAGIFSGLMTKALYPAVEENLTIVK